MKNGLLIFPPGGDNTYPHLSLPILAAQLKANDYNVKCLDLNIEFVNDIFSSDYLQKTTALIKSFYQKYSAEEREIYNSHNKNLIDKYNEIKRLLSLTSDINIDNLSNMTDKALKIIKSPINKSDFAELKKANEILTIAGKILAAPYYPSFFQNYYFNFYFNLEDLTYSELKNIIFSEDLNIYYNYCRNKLKDIPPDKYDYIGISIGVMEQFISGLTIANLLKENTNAHINIGGSYITRQIENIVKNKELFKIFTDSFSYGEGEKSIIELAKFINKEIPIENVHRLVYMKNDEIYITEPSESVDINEIIMPDFSDYDLDKYIAPMHILPLQIHRGCKWGKCSFCDISMEKTQSTKDIDKLIEELKYYNTKFNVEYFYIIDEAVYPEYLDKLSSRLIKEKLNLKFMMDCRFDDGFNYKLLKKMRKAGFVHISWGFESANKRICKLINKGVNINNRLKILKAADKAGIFNHVYCIINFPSETFEEAKETIDFIDKHKNVIMSSSLHPFRLLPSSLISKHPNSFGIKILQKNRGDFETEMYYETEKSMNRYEINYLYTLHNAISQKRNFFLLLKTYYSVYYYVGEFGLKELKKLNKKLQKTKINNH